MKPELDFSDFNDTGELKIPLGLILSLLYLSRHLLFLMLGGLSQFLSRGGEFKLSVMELPLAWTLFLDIPAFLFLLMILRREKLADGGVSRRLLPHGVTISVALGAAQIILLLALEHRILLKPDLLRALDLLALGILLRYLIVDPKLKLFFRECGATSAEQEAGDRT